MAFEENKIKVEIILFRTNLDMPYRVHPFQGLRKYSYTIPKVKESEVFSATYVLLK